MTYRCRDCSYKGPTSGPAGECPGCGSFALSRERAQEAERHSPRWRLLLLAGLWTCLIILIVRKLYT